MNWIFCIGVDSLCASWTHLVSWQNHTTNTNSCQQPQSERGTHQNLNAARAKWSVHTGSRLFVNHRLLSSLPFCNQTQKSKLLSCRYTLGTWTLPLTVLTVQSRKDTDLAVVAPRNHITISVCLNLNPTLQTSLKKFLPSIKQLHSLDITLHKQEISDTEHTTIRQHLSRPSPAWKTCLFYGSLTQG